VFRGALGPWYRTDTKQFRPRRPPREPAEVRARRLAGKKTDITIDVLEVDPDQVNHGKPIRVDVANRAVIVIDRPR
jgi:hypothetical protein